MLKSIDKFIEINYKMYSEKVFMKIIIFTSIGVGCAIIFTIFNVILTPCMRDKMAVCNVNNFFGRGFLYDKYLNIGTSNNFQFSVLIVFYFYAFLFIIINIFKYN